MNKKPIDPFVYSSTIAKALEQGVFLTTKAGEKVNSMVIGWGTLGVIYEKPVFVAYVRNNRFTHDLLAQNPEFGVNVPLGKIDPKAIRICGSFSGRDKDKIKEAGLTLVEPSIISVPGIAEFPLTLECRIFYKQDQVTANLPKELQNRFYSREKGTYHTMYYGEILDSYILEE